MLLLTDIGASIGQLLLGQAIPALQPRARDDQDHQNGDCDDGEDGAHHVPAPSVLEEDESVWIMAEPLAALWVKVRGAMKRLT